jgi:hypothetical protein
MPFTTTMAQFSILGGGNICEVRNNNLLENQKPILKSHYGLSVRYYPFKRLPKFSVQNEILINKKGYKQELGRTYLFHFTYLSIPILLNYTPVKNLSINAGIEASKLLYTSVKQGRKTYNNSDFGIVLGVNGFDQKRINIYSRLTYGITPMIDYYSFDKLGNFVGKIHDLKNICISIGLKYNLYNEEIHLFK